MTSGPRASVGRRSAPRLATVAALSQRPAANSAAPYRSSSLPLLGWFSSRASISGISWGETSEAPPGRQAAPSTANTRYRGKNRKKEVTISLLGDTAS